MLDPLVKAISSGMANMEYRRGIILIRKRWRSVLDPEIQNKKVLNSVHNLCHINKSHKTPTFSKRKIPRFDLYNRIMSWGQTNIF